ncbi:protein suppressor of hairy wing isoform X2 [Scaptodrosophila lebanonensis]|nr:protein suppressor of hairy wing isoform X2 [Scaptodrosophila lebanonensis]
MSKEDKGTTDASLSSGVIKVLGVEHNPPPREKRSVNTPSSGTRLKLLNDVAAAGGGKATLGSYTKPDKRLSSGSSRIKILNEDSIATKAAKRNSAGASNKTIPNTATVKILNDKRIVSAATPIETTKIKTPPTRKKKMDHYVLHAVKGENNKADTTCSVIVDDDDDTIDFILAEENINNKDQASEPVAEELTVSEEEDEDGEEGEPRSSANSSDIKEIVEHVCGKCYKTFRRVKSLKKHLEFCRYDSGYHLRKADMLKNLDKIEKDAVVMEKKDICFCCSESYDTFHLGHINCPDCPKSFKTQTSYERHIFITHSEFNDFPCSICNAKLRSEALLKLHEEQHKIRGKPYACKICGKDFTRSYHLKRHQKYSSCSASENDTMSCKVCDRVFYRLDNLRAHLKQHLGTQVVKKPEYMCHICKNCFYSLSTLNIHIRTHTGEKPFDCDLCDKKFSALVALKKHRRYHTGEKPYSCTVCNQSFAVKEVLNRHMKRHTGERPHKCNECGKSFIQATQLRTHSKTHLRPYSCDQCDEKFKTEKQLDRHIKDHTRQKRASFICSLCNQGFRTDELLKQHIEEGKHTPKTTRPKRSAKVIERTDCAICDKNFDSTDRLRAHIRSVHECNPDDIFGTEPHAAKRTKKTKKLLETPSNTSGSLISSKTNSNGVVVREYLVDEGDGITQSITLENETYTILPLNENQESIITTNIETEIAAATPDVKPESKEQMSPMVKKEQRKSLAASLAAAIADNGSESLSDDELNSDVLSENDLKLKENIGKLIDMLVDPPTLQKYGWPNTSEETVLCKVIENCGHDLTRSGENYAELDYGTRMREYAKLLFTVVIHNDSIKSLLNNFPIDDVIEYVLGSDDDQDEGKDDKGRDQLGAKTSVINVDA